MTRKVMNDSPPFSHAETVRRYNVPGKCRVRIGDWPYDCIAKEEHYDHVVYICDEHRVWWHEPDSQPTEWEMRGGFSRAVREEE